MKVHNKYSSTHPQSKGRNENDSNDNKGSKSTKNTTKIPEGKYDSYCYFWNNSPFGCKNTSEECKFKHEEAPHCKHEQNCMRLNTVKLCQFYHPQEHFLEARRRSNNPPNRPYQRFQRTQEEQRMAKRF